MRLFRLEEADRRSRARADAASRVEPFARRKDRSGR
jgi:hypothetical protein